MSKYHFQYEMKSEYFLPEILDTFHKFVSSIASTIPLVAEMKQDPIDDRSFIYYRTESLVEQAVGYRKKVAYYSHISILQLILIRYFQFKKMSIAKMKESQIFSNPTLVIDTFQNIFGMQVVVNKNMVNTLDNIVSQAISDKPNTNVGLVHDIQELTYQADSYAAKQVWNALALSPNMIVSYRLNGHPYEAEMLRAFAKIVEHFDSMGNSGNKK